MAVMDHAPGATAPGAPPKVSWINDPRIRGAFWQFLLIAFVTFLVYSMVTNAYENLQTRRIASGFGFLNTNAGFGLTMSIIPYSEASSYGRAFIVGLLNTLVIAAIGVVAATILGTFIGIARLSKNWIVRQLATVYVEFLRNIPLVLQLFFWYSAVLRPLPAPRQSVGLPDGVFGLGIFLNNRGLAVPKPIYGDLAIWLPVAAVLGIVAAIALARWAHRRQEATGQQFPVIWSSLGLVIGVPLIAFFLLGRPITLDYPRLGGFNIVGGDRIIPEFAALLLGLVLYTAAFIAEIVRAGIMAVHRGQTEASYALGLRPADTLRLVVLPQALRVIVPPLTSQYLNLTKNSSLAVAIGYPDLFMVSSTINNQTGQAVEVIFMMMSVYLLISLLTSAFMNWYNSRIALVER
jgi:general L-amino acid transport system permease protein